MSRTDEIKRLLAENNVIVPKGLKVSDLPRVSRPDKAIRAINFAQMLCTHTKGRWAGQKFRLLPWQFVLFWQVYGHCDEQGRRIYRRVYVEIPKKNGKTELAAVMALIGLCADDEMGAEVYSAAGDRDQATLVYAPAAQMVRNSKTLKKRLKIIDSRRRIVDYKTSSYYQVLSAEAFTKHGLSPHVVVFDELHSQPNRELWDVLTEGTDAAREQQLIVALTTAGIFDVNHIAWEMHDYACKVRDGIIEDPHFLPVIYNVEPEADWNDEKLWAAANPSLGHIFDLDNLRKHHTEAKNQPLRINNFKRYRLNQWVAQATRVIPMDHWDACDTAIPEEALLGRPCFGALDLSSKLDLSALALVFEPFTEGEFAGLYPVLPWFFMPEATLLERAQKDLVPYEMWARSGKIITTPGDVIDYQAIRQVVQKAKLKFDIQELGYDPWGSTQLALQLQEEDGMTMVEVRQGYKTFSEPFKELLALTVSHKLAHGAHPVLRWCADNVAADTDAAGNIKPAKDKSTGRIDGVVALIMALSRMIVHEAPVSVYESRDLLIL